MFPAALTGNTRRESPSWGHFGIHKYDWWHGDADSENSPLPREKWWLFGFFLPVSAPSLLLSRTHLHYISRMQTYRLVLPNINKATTVDLKSPIISNFFIYVCRVKYKKVKTHHWKLMSLSGPHFQICFNMCDWQKGHNNFTIHHSNSVSVLQGLTKSPSHSLCRHSHLALFNPLHPITWQ